MTQPRPQKALVGLTDDQLNQLAEWIEVHSYRKAVELAREKFQRYIPKTTLQRFIAHGRAKEVLDDSPDSLEAAREINRFAATAETDFSSATIHILERQAFELALARQDNEDLDTLKDLMFLLQRHRANGIHERRVHVQEEKLALKKAEIANEAKAAEEGDTFSAAIDHLLAKHPAFAPKNPSPTLNLTPPPQTPLAAPPVTTNENCSIPNAQGNPPSLPPVQNSAPSGSEFVHPHLASHTRRRWLAYTRRPPGNPPPDDSWINECPCGAPLPCRQHGQLWREVRYVKPWDSDYAAALARYQIPFQDPPDLAVPNSRSSGLSTGNRSAIPQSATPK
jgi:hypothetical protein